MLRKDISILELALLSAQRSEQFYVETKVLEKPESADQRHSSNSDAAQAEQAIGMTASDHSVKERCTLTETFKSVVAVITVWLNLANPFLFQGAIFKRAGITSGSAQTKLKKAAFRFGFIIEHKLQVFKTILSVWEPTDIAYQKAGIQKPHYHSKGGYLHQFVIHHIKEWGIQNGFVVKIEFFLTNNKPVDAAMWKGETVIFWEVVMSEPMEKEIQNIIKDCETDLQPERLTLAVKDGKMKKKLEQLIANDSRLDTYRDRIEVVLAGNFVGKS